jgi:hypothetical protein
VAPAEAQRQLQHLVGQSPAHCGLARSGWWLEGIRQAVHWLHDRCLATVSQPLRRAQVVDKRGRRHVHSPDPAYAAKLATVTYGLCAGAPSRTPTAW